MPFKLLELNDYINIPEDQIRVLFCRYLISRNELEKGRLLYFYNNNSIQDEYVLTKQQFCKNTYNRFITTVCHILSLQDKPIVDTPPYIIISHTDHDKTTFYMFKRFDHLSSDEMVYHYSPISRER